MTETPCHPPVLDVASAGFAYLKGTRHEPRTGFAVSPSGPVGDRRYCLVDVTKRQVLRSVQHPQLVRVTVEDAPDGLRIAAPGVGTVHQPAPGTDETFECDYWGRPASITLTGGDHSRLLSDFLGKPVRLGLAPAGSVVYGAPVSLVATASIRDLGERIGHPDLLAEFARFRPSLLIRTERPYEEEEWEGLRLPTRGLDRDVTLRIGPPIPRCAVIDTHPITGERDVKLMKALAAYRPRNERGEPRFGVNAYLD